MSKQSYEAAIRELEKITENLEQNETPLEEALKQYEKGIALLRNCHELIQQAEGKFKVLNGEVEKVLTLKEASPVALEDLTKE